MVTEGAALAVMGNHEFNAIAWYTLDPGQSGEYLRPHCSKRWGSKNYRQHRRFLKELSRDAVKHADIISWFKTLPLWLEMDGIRIVHACWHQRFMDWLAPRLAPGRLLPDGLLVPATHEPETDAEKDDPEPSVFRAVEALTKGLEVTIPRECAFRDKDGILRDRARVSWWQEGAGTYPHGDRSPGSGPQLPSRHAPPGACSHRRANRQAHLLWALLPAGKPIARLTPLCVRRLLCREGRPTRCVPLGR